VLIVDDNEVNRQICGAFCEMAGYQYQYAVDGVQALDAVACGRFDLVLMDIHMPRMDGVAAARAIRALPHGVSSVPIIAVTTSAEAEYAERYREAGLSAVVAKPITPARLLEAMAVALGEHRSSEPRRTHQQALRSQRKLQGSATDRRGT
jgi:CheY-like chemotaxis protein